MCRPAFKRSVLWSWTKPARTKTSHSSRKVQIGLPFHGLPFGRFVERTFCSRPVVNNGRSHNVEHCAIALVVGLNHTGIQVALWLSISDSMECWKKQVDYRGQNKSTRWEGKEEFYHQESADKTRDLGKLRHDNPLTDLVFLDIPLLK